MLSLCIVVGVKRNKYGDEVEEV